MKLLFKYAFVKTAEIILMQPGGTYIFDLVIGRAD